jgi:hypothetical protein
VTDVDPADSVRELLEKTKTPMPTEQIVQALSALHGKREIVESLDFWRREHHSVVHDDQGNWVWQGPGLT